MIMMVVIGMLADRLIYSPGWNDEVAYRFGFARREM